MNNTILVIGSNNIDMVIQTKKFPGPGETILGGKFFMNQGGKGANQAVAASRLGGKVGFISKIGNDIFGLQSMDGLENEGINTSYIKKDSEHASGVAMITVDKNGENCIVVAPGANNNLLKSDIDESLDLIIESEIILIQLEIPRETVEYTIDLAHKLGKIIILNPAPAISLSTEILTKVTYLIPNISEAEYFTGQYITDMKSVKKASETLLKMGIQNVIITLGKDGAYVRNSETSIHIPPPEVKPIDSTAAGDTFNGAFAVAISEGFSIQNAVIFANTAAAMSVTRLGAQSSIPNRKEVTPNYSI